jgi:hypothetical protein
MSRGAGRGALLVAVSVAVGLAVAAGLFLLGSPVEERERKLDEARLADLRVLRDAVADHFDRTGTLPASLAALASPDRHPLPLQEPGGRGLYEYEALGDRSFRLCATFDHVSEAEAARPDFDPWTHRAGRQCYRFDLGRVATPERGRELLPLAEDEPAPTP